ncbi:PAS domain-containing protein [Tenacibaculum sp. IB213877]|uniref:PAS domain-containing protein n=1 Tax=Tenacibaculum sp. IB213877 TaxID=3097351 RepID=UPI002A5ABB71|nr:PAS domain-containing protein [Tenacibaculum sp. IB213877]MDY0781068.1 PAS domain-containing protein [Tenacibaculum sp. IB213877]
MKKTIGKYVQDIQIMPLISWDIYSQFTLTNKESLSQDLKQLSLYASKFNWEHNFKSILQNNTYDALVLTNNLKEIIWVNKGFTKMTGYTKKQVINKKPSFLQGKDTSESKKIVIRKKLNGKIPFKEVILNYKKDGTPYKCEIYIIPIKKEKVTHYLALERAV